MTIKSSNIRNKHMSFLKAEIKGLKNLTKNAKGQSSRKKYQN